MKTVFRRARSNGQKDQASTAPAKPAAAEPAEERLGAVSNPSPTPQDRLQLFGRLLSPFPPGRLLDLGAGHGKFSIMAHDLGWKVTAVDARTTRFPDHPGINWVHSDVREFPIAAGEYDVIAILGLLYHLEAEAQIDLMRKVSHTPTLVDTHVSTDDDKRLNPHGSALGGWVTREGYTGRDYREVEYGTAEQRDATPTASWGNAASFWPTEQEQLRMFTDCGFSSVMVLEPHYLYARTFYLCLP